MAKANRIGEPGRDSESIAEYAVADADALLAALEQDT